MGGRLSLSIVRHGLPIDMFRASSRTSISRQHKPLHVLRAIPSVSHHVHMGFTRRFSSYPPHTLFPFPALSPTMESGSIQAWHKNEGDAFAAGDVLCTIDTDKASVDFEAQDDGFIAKILVSSGAGEDVRIGVPICVVVEDPDLVSHFANYTVPESDAGSAGVSPPSGERSADSAPTPAPSTVTPEITGGGPSLLMPSARHLSESKGLDATSLKGSGKGGRVTKEDVLLALENGSLTTPLAKKAQAPTHLVPPTPPSQEVLRTLTVSAPTTEELPLPVIVTAGSFEDTPNNKMRKIIASRLTASKREVPHFYTSQQVQLDNIMALRKTLAAEHDVKVSVNDFVLRCCALALRDVPEVNGTLDPKTQALRHLTSIDISVAVATPTGLITPIVFNADQLGLSEITETVKDLASRARAGKLAPHEYQGGTFSVSNLGMFGVDEFSAVINPPQAAILAVGGGSRRLVPSPYVESDAMPSSPLPTTSKPGIRTLMTARLSADRRVVDEATASLFLSAFSCYANEPDSLLL
jgi:pyruvate dehydrogenase E2 component (dihydrolipoamide acetyltransferase)